MSSVETGGLNYLTATEKFVEAAAMANKIADQNDRLVVAREDIDDNEFLALAEQGLSQEQADTLTALQEAVNDTPYAELATVYLDLENEVNAVKLELDERKHGIDREAFRIRQLAQLTSRLAPYVTNEAKNLAEIRANALHDASIEELEALLAEKEQELVKLDRIYEIVSKPWAVPQTERLATISTRSETYQEIVDEIPVEPQPIDHEEEERMQEYSQRHVDQPEASRLAAFYLKEFSPEIMTVDDLMAFLYSEQVIEQHSQYNMRARITTTLGPKVRGAQIASMLAEDGLVLQYGWRLILTKDKQSDCILNRSRTRIYRAIPFEDFTEEHLEPETNRMDISEIEEQTETLQWRSTEQLARLIGENAIRQIKEVEADQLGDLDPSKKVVVKPGRILRMEKVPAWVPNFTEQVKHALTVLNEQELISPGLLSQDVIRLKSRSAKMGTDEAIKRLARAKLINRQKAADKVFDSRDVVLMHLFNTNRDILTTSSKNKEKALEVIDREVERFLAANPRGELNTNGL